MWWQHVEHNLYLLLSSRIGCPMKCGACRSLKIHHLRIKLWLNSSSQVSKRTHENKICFQVGDKVCCTKNGYISGKDEGKKARRSRSQRKKEQMKNERMYNGEIFFIKKGSEAETIVYVLRNNFAENWQHVYTAVTRGQKCVYVVGTECDLEGAIKKWIPPRNTQLCGLLKAIVAQQGPEASKRHAESDPCTKPSKLVKVTNL
ncbi:DNA helicase B-like isoform X3 [Chanodichthys erythropterus]|uniref:DNA helicase B-like isoform X3 n=1 Tax=Chanodichthys erythropterus TaxID=933992 RepID=UPI00351ED0EC